MKRNLIACICAVAALALIGCGGSSRMAKSTSTRVDLARSVRYIPTLANINVQPTRVSATCTAAELESLKGEPAKQTIVAKALATVNADVLIAPIFTTEKGEDGKMVSMTVTGYPATITSFRSLQAGDAPVLDVRDVKQKHYTNRMTVNTMTVAEVEYGAKVSLTLEPGELAGKKEADALKYAKQKMLRNEKADFLYEPQYSIVVVDGAVSTFTLTAFPARYINYRTASAAELSSLAPGSKPVVYYNTTADIQPVSGRVQKRFSTTNATAKPAELKETARAAILAKYNADFLLNEQFYFDYQDKVITHVTICGTPAVYTNFRPLQAGDVIDTRLVHAEGVEPEEEAPQSFLDMFLGLFKKK